VRRASLLACVLLAAGLSVAPSAVRAQTGGTGQPKAEPLPPEVVRGHCSVCHSYSLVEQQRLNRANWEWVMDDMIDKYGATWIDAALRERIVDYLAKHHGP